MTADPVPVPQPPGDERRLTQPDWCNAPQPGNWHNACMRSPGHDGEHAVRKPYRGWDEAWFWPAYGGYPVSWRSADHFPDLWHPDDDDAPSAAAPGVSQ